MTSWVAGTSIAPVRRLPTRTALFAYSAVTWNAHRIHIDLDYVRSLGHDDLLVHGALQADWVLQVVGEAVPGEIIRFSYRTLTPAYLGQEFEVGGQIRGAGPEGVEVEAWVQTPAGERTLEGTVSVRV